MDIQIDREFVLHQLPRRPRNAHKGTFGTLLVLAGSRPYRGAAQLAAAAALRAGTGLVRLGSTEAVCSALAAALPCCILHPMRESPDGAIDPAALPAAMETRHTAILAGPGITATQNTALWVLSLLKKAACPLVLDADALNIVAGHLEGGEDAATRSAGLDLLKAAELPILLTPHPGEMARLCGATLEEVAQNPRETALGFAKKYNCTVVLKNHKSTVATAQGGIFTLTEGENPGLSKGGSGDVLAGLIAGLLAQGFTPEVAAAAGVWLHAEAGRKAVCRQGEAGLSPADLPLFLAEVWRDLGR